MRHRVMFWRLALVLGSMAFGIVLVEVALRAVNASPDNFWQPDPVLGYAHIPGKRGFWRSSCFETPVTINSWGFRGPEWTREKPPGTYRVLVLGDSMTEALQVPSADAFPALLEAHLNDGVSGRRIEVLNLGVSGYGTGQHYLNLVHRGLAFQPDLVILAFLVVNDVRESSAVLEAREDKPYFRLTPDSTLDLLPFRYPPRYHTLKNTIRGLHLYRFYGLRLARSDWGREILLRAGLAAQMNPQLDRELRGTSGSNIPFDLTVYARTYPEEWQQAWDVVSAIVGQMKREAERNGARFVLVGIPSVLEVTEPERIEMEYPGFIAGYETDSPYRTLEAVAARHEIHYLPLVPAFRSAIAAGTSIDDFYYPCDLHFAPAGHQLVASELTRTVAPLISAVD